VKKKADERTHAKGRVSQQAKGEFRAIYRRHIGLVWRALRRSGVPEEHLDDAAQEVFVVFHRRMSEIEPERVPAFLYEASRRVAANALRGRARRDRREHEADAPLAHPNAEEQLERGEAAQVIEAFLQTLPLEQRAAFELVELEGLTLREAAEVSNDKLQTIATRVRRARERFRIYLTTTRVAERDDG
jgi:RNA polymerase sigma-70 factor (ECF subfamily)